MKKILNKNNLILILIIMTLFNLIMPTVSYAANISINDVLKETVAGWYAILRAISVAVMLILLLVIAIKGAVSNNAGDKSLLKRMLGDWIIALILVLFIHYFMIIAINLNEAAVSGARSLGSQLSGMEEDQEISLYESTITKAYEVKFKPGTIGMILYIMLVYYAYKFTLVYLKRYVNVLVLILIAPIVCCFYAFKKVLTGKGVTLKKWFKEFIYNVFLQSLHATMYATLVGLSIKFSADGESFVGAIITMILFAVIFKVDKLVRKLFNSVGGDTSIAISKIDRAGSTIKNNLTNVGSTAAVSTVASVDAIGGAILHKNSIGDEFQKIKPRYGDKIDWGKVGDGIKSDSKETWNLAKDGVTDFYNQNKEDITDVFADMEGTIKGKYKYVSEEAIAKEQEKMDNAGFLGKTWFAVLGAPEAIHKKIKQTKELIESKKEGFRKYLEEKKRKAITYVEDLQKDVETVKYIPTLIRDVKKLPSLVMQINPKNRQLEYNDNFEAIFDVDVKPDELNERLQTLINISSSGHLATSVVLAQGYESLLRCPKIGLMLLAEQNYKDMVHPEIPMEQRKAIAGYKKEEKSSYHFSNFGNGTIRKFERIVVVDSCQAYAGLRSLKKVAVGVQNKTITYRPVPEDADKTVIHYKGKANASRQLQQNIQFVLGGLRSFQSDTQVARNIGVLNEVQRIRDSQQLSNLSPEMIRMLEKAGIAIRVDGTADFKGGYIILDQVIENYVMIQKLNDYFISHLDDLVAQRLSEFLMANQYSDIALRMCNYVIDNPDCMLAKMIGNIELTGEGQLVQKVESFRMDGDISQLGIISENTIVQTIITTEGIVEQVIDFQGHIINQAVNEDGSPVQFYSNETGMIIQTVLTPEGSLIQQILSEDKTTIKPVVFNEGSEEIVDLSEEGQEKTVKQKLRSDLTQISQENVMSFSIDLSTGKTESVLGIQDETAIITVLLDQVMTETTPDKSEEESLSKLNDLLGQITVHQGEELAAELLQTQMDRVLIEAVREDGEEFAKSKHLPIEELDAVVSRLETSRFITGYTDGLGQDESDMMFDIRTVLFSDTESTSSSTFDNIMSTLYESDVSGEQTEQRMSLEDAVAVASRVLDDGTQSETQTLYENIMSEIASDVSTGVEDEEPSNPLLDAILSTQAEAGSVEEKETIYEILDNKPRKKEKSRKKSSDSENEPKKTVEFYVGGAVNNPNKKFTIEVGKRVFEAIQMAGGFAKNADKSKIQNELNSVIDEKNTSIFVPAIQEEHDEGIIQCYIFGAVKNPGPKTLEKGSTIADLILEAGHLTERADKDGISLNSTKGMKVQIGYVLSDDDHVFVPEISIEDSDKQKGINTKAVEETIRKECDDYLKRNKVALEELKEDKKTRDYIIDRIAKSLDKQKIKLTQKDIEERFDVYVDKMIKENAKQAQMENAKQNILENITVVRDNQTPEGAQADIDRLLSTLDSSKVKIERKQNKVEPKRQSKKEHKSEDIMRQIQALMGAG